MTTQRRSVTYDRRHVRRQLHRDGRPAGTAATNREVASQRLGPLPHRRHADTVARRVGNATTVVDDFDVQRTIVHCERDATDPGASVTYDIGHCFGNDAKGSDFDL